MTDFIGKEINVGDFLLIPYNSVQIDCLEVLAIDNDGVVWINSNGAVCDIPKNFKFIKITKQEYTYAVMKGSMV